MAAEFVSSLTDSEKMLLSQRDDFELANLIDNVEQLAAQLSDVPRTVEYLRTLNPAEVAKFGNKAHRLVYMLAQQPPLESPIPRESLALAPESVLEPVASDTLEVEEEPVRPEPVRVEQQDEPKISPEANHLLTIAYGDAWEEVLGVTEETLDLDAIAWKMVEVAPPNKPRTKEEARAIILARLQGRSYTYIANEFPGMTLANARQFTENITRRVAKAKSENKSEVEVEVAEGIEDSPITIIDVAPVVEPAETDHQLSIEERERILRQSIEQPSYVSPAEWREVAESYLLEVAPQAGLSDEEARALWGRLHFGDNDEQNARLTPEARNAINKIQELLMKHKTILDKKLHAQVAVKGLTNTAIGRGSVDDSLSALRRIDTSVTKNLAQRYTVDGVLELINAER